MCVWQWEPTAWRTACGPNGLLEMVSRTSLLTMWISAAAAAAEGVIGPSEESGDEESGAAEVEYTEVVHPQPGASAPGDHLHISPSAKRLLFSSGSAQPL